MREILFRGKRIDNGEWIYGGISIFCGLAEIFDSNSIDNSCYEVIPETVGQFTGLTDKNGKKIFEGDIIQGFIPNDFDKKRTEIVKHANSASGTDRFCIGFRSWLVKIEVLGNIHDNPELLNPTIA